MSIILNCIIVEDEPLAMARLEAYVRKVPFLDLQACFNNGQDALVYLSANTVDLVFLDINLGDLSGIRLLETSQVKTQVIFTTAYQEYALKGYDLNITDYLLKPFTFERFMQAVSKAKEATGKNSKPGEKDFIFVKTEYRLERVLLDEIIYIEGMRDYRRIHTTSKKIMTLKTFREFEQEIPPARVCRIHKSFAVAMNKIESIEGNQVRIGNLYLPISDTYKKQFFDLVNQ